MAWSFPVLRFTWSAIKWAGKSIVTLFRWAWTSPEQSVTIGVGLVAFSWLARTFGWQEVASWSSSLGWVLITLGATGAVAGATVDLANDVSRTLWDVQVSSLRAMPGPVGAITNLATQAYRYFTGTPFNAFEVPNYIAPIL